MSARTHSPPRGLLLVFALAAILATLAETGPARAQVEPAWNREVAELGLVPDASQPGTMVLVVLWRVQAANPGTIFDLSTTLLVEQNGTAIGNFAWDILNDNPTQSCTLNCGNDCGGLYVDGVFNTMTCHEDAEGDCQCGYWFTTEVPGLDPAPGDVFYVQLAAAAGALPDADTGDDEKRLVFEGESVGWNRRGVGVAVHENATGGHDLSVLVELTGSGATHALNLSTEAEIQIDGVPYGDRLAWQVFLDPSIGICEGFGCTGGCGSLYEDGVINAMVCHQSSLDDCDCGYWLTANVPGVPVEPGDEIMVILRPAPGAVPDLDPGDDRFVTDFAGEDVGWGLGFRSVSAVPAGQPGIYDFFAVIDLDVAGLYRAADLSGEVEVRIGGTTVEVLDLGGIFAGPPSISCALDCGSDCGPMYLDGVFNTLLCRHEAPLDCECGYWLALDVPGLEPGGQDVEFFLRPAPQGAPAPGAVDAHDYQLWRESFGARAAWVRAATDLRYAVNRDGTVAVDCAVGLGQSEQFQDLSFTVDLEVDGIVVASQTQPFLYVPDLTPPLCQPDCTGGGCGTFTDAAGAEVAAASCDTWPGFADCVCGGQVTVEFAGVTVPEGAEMRALISPAPGALPDVPGFDDLHAVVWDGVVVGVGEGVPAPAGPTLEPNRPNPFNPRTDIVFRMHVAGPVTLTIYDSRGALVRRLVDEDRPVGRWTATWDGRNEAGRAVASGHYLAQLRVGDRELTRSMVLVR